MKSIPVSIRLAQSAAVLSFLVAAAGCKNGTAATADRKPIPLASVGVASSGIGAPGGDSEDTRAVGSVATGEGDQPADAGSGVTPVVATPGAVKASPGRY